MEHICVVTLLSSKHALTGTKCLMPFFYSDPIPDFNEFSVSVNCHEYSNKESYSIEQVETTIHHEIIGNIRDYNVAVITVSS